MIPALHGLWPCTRSRTRSSNWLLGKLHNLASSRIVLPLQTTVKQRFYNDNNDNGKTSVTITVKIRTIWRSFQMCDRHVDAFVRRQRKVHPLSLEKDDCLFRREFGVYGTPQHGSQSSNSRNQLDQGNGIGPADCRKAGLYGAVTWKRNDGSAGCVWCWRRRRWCRHVRIDVYFYCRD